MRKTFLTVVICCLLTLDNPDTGVTGLAPDNFVDIKGHWGEGAIIEVFNEGFMQGIANDEQGYRVFAPDMIVTKSQTAVGVVPTFRLDYGQVRFIKQPQASDYFKDVDNNDWYASALAKCGFNQIFTSKDNLFNPDQPISRFEMALAIQRCFKAKDINVPIITMMPLYQDIGNLSSDDQQTIAFVTNTGIMKGDGGLFRPEDSLTRAELAQVLSNSVKVAHGQVDLADKDNGQDYDVSPGQSFVLALPSNPSTGYQWDFTNNYDSNIVLLMDSYYRSSSPNSDIIGGGGTSYWRFKALKPGSTELNLSYKRPWDKETPTRSFTVKVTVIGSSVAKTGLNIITTALKENSKSMIVDMKVPVISGLQDTSVASALNARWLKDANDFKFSVASGLDDHMKYSTEQGIEITPFGAYSSYEICSIKPDILSMYVDYYQYTGGAHGLTDRKAYNINIKTGQDFGLKDLFVVGFEHEKLINQIIQEKINSTPEFYFSGPGSFSGIADKQEYYIKDDQLVIYFQQYEIAAYAVGIPEFPIPLSELADGLRNDWF